MGTSPVFLMRIVTVSVSPRISACGASSRKGGRDGRRRRARSRPRARLFEKNPEVGGKLARLETNGYAFDLGPSLLTLPEHGLVVSVISNISYAGTYDLALKIAEAFAEGK